ncbi:phage tail tape measure protein [Streptomyces sp. NPDC001185]|uniref:phage tail tape measure protein n=1 Tax=Streptomyces sp. NPDC001185 TaxID=3154380 RepID=UPI0033286D1E
MATRSVTVRLRADITSYTRGMRTAARDTSRLAGAGVAVGTAMVTGFAIAAAAAAKFDKSLSNVRAVTGASSKDMAKLRAAALEAGKTTSYTATEAADAEAELARAGVSVANITGGALKGSLALAASGQLDLSESATIAAQTMNTFGLKGKDVSHIADVLSASANKSASDVHGLGMSLRMGGLLAHQTGLSLEETVGTLSAFADHALIGSDAGTSLKVMLQRLVPQSDEAKAAMDKIGFSAYDGQGKFVGLSEMAGRMKTAFSKLTPEARNSAMSTIFGSDAVRSATIMYELGSEGIDKYVKSVNDQGAASRMAAIQTDNLVGDFERLKGAIEVALIEGGSAANGSLRTMTQWITKLVNAYSSLPPDVQKAITLLTGVGGAATLAVTGFVLLLPRIAATRAAMASMGFTAARTRTAMLRLGQIGAVVAGLELVSFAANKITDQFKDAPPSVSKMAASLVDLAKSGKAGGEAARVFGKNLDGFAHAVQRVAHPTGANRATDIVNSVTLGLTEGIAESDIALQDARDQIKSVDEALAGLVSGGAPDVAAKAFTNLAAAAAEQGTSTDKLLTLMPGYTDALANTDTQSKLSAGAQAKLGAEAGITADALKDQRSEAEKLSDALQGLNGSSIDAGEAEINFRQSLADLNTTVKENGHSLDVTTDKGRKVKSAFFEVAKSAMEHAKSIAQQTNSQKAGQKALSHDIELLKKDMIQRGFSKDAVDKLAKAYLQLPPVVATKVDAKTAGAMADLAAIQSKIKGTKGRTFTMSALTKEARSALESLGFKIKTTKGKSVSITIPTGTPKAAISSIQRYINGMQGKTVPINIVTTHTDKGTVFHEGGNYARGGRVRGYASGGNVQMGPNGLVSGPGTGTSDSILGLFASGAVGRVSDTEFVVNAQSTRKYLPLLTAINQNKIPGFASGGLLGGFSYTPTAQAVLGGPSDAKTRYDKGIENLKKAWDDLNTAVKDAKKKADALKDAEKNLSRVRHGHHTAAQLRAAESRVDKARTAKKASDKKVREERADVNAADKALGLKNGSKAPTSFNLKGYEAQLGKSVAATQKWRGNLNRIAVRGGNELRAMLEGMGEEGYSLVNALAGASNKQFKSITDKLQKTGELAKATLADFTKQLGASTKDSQQFAKDLQTLAANGFGDLAQALAAQGDASAMTLAHQAAGDNKQAATANSAVGKAQNTLTGEDLANSLILLSTLRGGVGRGYADLIAAGLDTATIKALVPKMTAQIGALPAANKETFVRQWVQQGGKAMARGGVLDRPTMVLGGEAGDRESWIPWNGSARSQALLAKTAAGMGYQLVPAGRYGGGPVSAAAMRREVTRQITVNLYGAKQTTAEQAADVARHMVFVG